MCAALAAKRHGAWRGRRLNDADLVFCERKRLEQLIEELKGQGLVSAGLGGVTKLVYKVQAGIPLPFIGKAVSAEASRQIDLVVDPARVGDTVRLNALLDLMIRGHLLSDFVGRPLEWEALNELARRIVPGAEAGEEIVRAQDNGVVAIASRNFNGVLREALSRLSLFPGKWAVQTVNGRRVARQQVALPGPLIIGSVAEPVTSLVLEFNVPNETALPVEGEIETVDWWLLGKIVRMTHAERERSDVLCMHFQTYAILLGDASPARQRQPSGAAVVSRSVASGYAQEV
jgi:hypothetical protein